MQFPICSYPTESQDKWMADLPKKRKVMQGVFQPIVNPVVQAADLYKQMLALAIQADNQAAGLQEIYMGLLRSLKSGEVSLDSVTLGARGGFEIISPEPPDETTYLGNVEIEIPESNGKKPRSKVAAVAK